VSTFVPPGWFLVTAKVLLTSGTSGAMLTRCVLALTSGPSLDLGEVTLADTGAEATMTLHAAAQIGSVGGDHITVSCQAGFSGGAAFASYPQLTAIQVSSVSIRP